MWLYILKPEIKEKYFEKEQPTENQKNTKYQNIS